MKKSQRDVVIDAFRRVSVLAEEGVGLARTGASPERLLVHAEGLQEVVDEISNALEGHLGASALLTRMGERPDVLSSSKG